MGAAVDSFLGASPCWAGSAGPGWGQSEPRGSPSSAGAKIPNANGVPYPCQAALSVKFSPRQGGSLNFGAPGCAGVGSKGALLPLGKQHCRRITHRATWCRRILEITEELRVRCFCSADGLDFPGSLQRCIPECSQRSRGRTLLRAPGEHPPM